MKGILLNEIERDGELKIREVEKEGKSMEREEMEEK